MQQPRNNNRYTQRSAFDLFAGFDKLIREYVIDRPRAKWNEIRGKFDNLPETNFLLGCDFANRGQWFDASLRFRMVIKLQPTHVQAHFNLANCYLQMGKLPEATEQFRQTLRLDPTHRHAQFLLSGVAPNAMSPEQLPRTMPRDMVEGFFTQVAADYDRLAEANSYQGARVVAEACRPYLKNITGLHLVDLGCGTGLVAKPWRGLCREILGVDITPAMVAASQVARSGDNPTFDRVITQDVNAIEPGTFMPGASDVVLCVDTAQFLGDLAPVMKTGSQALNNEGLFVLTIEPFNAPQGFGVNPNSGRFGHHPDYVRKVAAAHGLEVKRDNLVALYAGLNNQLFVFGKKAA